MQKVRADIRLQGRKVRHELLRRTLRNVLEHGPETEEVPRVPDRERDGLEGRRKVHMERMPKDRAARGRGRLRLRRLPVRSLDVLHRQELPVWGLTPFLFFELVQRTKA